MSAIKQWAFALCAAMVAAGLIQMLMPKSSMEKILRLVVSVFFLCCLLSPVVLRDPSLLVDIRMDADTQVESRSEQVVQIAEEQAVESARANLERLMREKLSQRGINVHALTINIITKGQNTLSLESVEIVLDAEHQELHDELTAELERELGVTVGLGYG